MPIKMSVPVGTTDKLKTYLLPKERTAFINRFIIKEYSELIQSRDVLKKRGDFERINVNLSDEAHEKLQALATIHDLKLSEVFRDALVPLLVVAEAEYVRRKNGEVDRISVLKEQLHETVTELKELLPISEVNELLEKHVEKRVFVYPEKETGLIPGTSSREEVYTVNKK